MMAYVNCFRRVVLDVNGKKITIDVPQSMTEEKMNKIMIVCRAYLQQYIYTEMVLAECFMQAIESSVQKKKCFKFAIKKKWTDCRKNLKKVIECYDSYVPNAEFNNEFAITFYEKINKDLYQLRDKIASRLQNLGVGEKSGLYANAIVLYNLTNLSIGTYENICKRLYEKLQVKLLKPFMDFCPITAFENSYDFMELVMGKDFKRLADHIISKDLLTYFDKVRDGIFNEETLNEAAMNATEDIDDATERDLQRSYVGIDEFISKDFSADSIKKKAS